MSSGVIVAYVVTPFATGAKWGRLAFPPRPYRRPDVRHLARRGGCGAHRDHRRHPAGALAPAGFFHPPVYRGRTRTHRAIAAAGYQSAGTGHRQYVAGRTLRRMRRWQWCAPPDCSRARWMPSPRTGRRSGIFPRGRGVGRHLANRRAVRHCRAHRHPHRGRFSPARYGRRRARRAAGALCGLPALPQRNAIRWRC